KNVVLAYQSGRIQPWYGQSISDRQVLYDRVKTAATTTVTAAPVGCFCLEPRAVAGGKYFVKVGGVDRDDYAPTPYRLRAGLTAYPQGFTADGGSKSCPAVPADGGAG